MVQRPSIRWSCCRSCCSLTELAVGLTEVGCWAATGMASTVSHISASAPSMVRMRATSAAMSFLLAFFKAPRVAPEPRRRLMSLLLRRNGFAVSGLPTPSARAVAALHHPFLVDLGDDLAVAGEQRLG